jgi:hypothetical protein
VLSLLVAVKIKLYVLSSVMVAVTLVLAVNAQPSLALPVICNAGGKAAKSELAMPVTVFAT